MESIKKSFDGGFSENLYFDDDFEKDFIEEKGFDEWTNYRNDWEKFCKLEKESDFPPHLEFELNYSCNLRCPMCTWAVENAAEKKDCSVHKKMLDKIKCRADNLKKNEASSTHSTVDPEKDENFFPSFSTISSLL